METKFNKIFRASYPACDLENSINELKKEGATQMECVKVLIAELHISLRNADEIILNSSAWKANKDDIITFREEFRGFLDNAD
jgi:hypothetical protein